MTPGARERAIGRLLRDRLIKQLEDGSGHRLLPAGYRAVGATPPRAGRKSTFSIVTNGVSDGEARRSRGKQAVILDLLARPDGASLPELIEVTGWLPHTTRAVLSRLRSAGTTLLKSKREDGATTYRIAPEQLAGRKGRVKNALPVEATAEDVAEASAEIMPDVSDDHVAVIHGAPDGGAPAKAAA